MIVIQAPRCGIEHGRSKEDSATSQFAILEARLKRGYRCSELLALPISLPKSTSREPHASVARSLTQLKCNTGPHPAWGRRQCCNHNHREQKAGFAVAPSRSSRKACHALASGGVERGVFTAHPRWVSSAKAKVLYVPLVHGLRDVDRPVVGSAKIPRILNGRGRTVRFSRMMFGRRGHLSS
jgi:hypothetical protein